jgi:hypothetical protein
LNTREYQNGNLHFLPRRELFNNSGADALEALQSQLLQEEAGVAMLHYNHVRMEIKEFCMALNGDWELDEVRTHRLFSGRYRQSSHFKMCFTPSAWDLFEKRDLQALLPNKSLIDDSDSGHEEDEES